MNRNNISGRSIALNARLSFSTRPCSPLESLVLGLISITEGLISQKQTNASVSKRQAYNQNIHGLHGQTDAIHAPYIDPYAVVQNHLKDAGHLLGIKKYLPTLRSLVTTYCPSRPLAGTYVRSF